MASEIYLNRFNKEMGEISISISDWKACENKINELKLVNDEGRLDRVEYFCKAINDWIPIFWIDSKGNGFMRQSGFFRFEESFEKAIKVAKNLDAIIWGEDGQILYEPNYGVIYDDCEPYETPTITFDDFLDKKIYFQEDVKKAIQELIREKVENLNNNSELKN